MGQERPSNRLFLKNSQNANIREIRAIILSGVLRNFVKILFRLLDVPYLHGARAVIKSSFLKKNSQNANIREIIPRNNSYCSFAKSRENFVQAAGCPVPAWDNGGHQIV
jgi:hypothetical protein